MDLRNSGFKLAPVDTNLFPGGFNNLNPAFLPLCVQAAMAAIEKICPDARNLLLIPENHTRNVFYLQNVAQLATILARTGLNVRVGSLLPEITAPTPIDLPNGQTLVLEPLRRTAYRLGLEGFDPCAVLLNNDLSAGIPEILTGLNEQFVLPPLHAGWAVRRKSNHFAAYDEVANNFAKAIGIDPWRINPAFSVCRSVNFHERQGEECLAANVAAVLDLVREKYREYEIDETPYVVVKADAASSQCKLGMLGHALKSMAPTQITADKCASSTMPTMRWAGSRGLSCTDGRPAAMQANMATGYQAEFPRNSPTARPTGVIAAI